MVAESIGMTRRADNERLKKQLEKDHADIVALQERIKKFAKLDPRRAVRRYDLGVIRPAPPTQKAG